MSQNSGRLPLAALPAVVPVVALGLMGLLLAEAAVVPEAVLALVAESALELVLLLLPGGCTAGRSFTGG